jgi:hypothetical protein
VKQVLSLFPFVRDLVDIEHPNDVHTGEEHCLSAKVLQEIHDCGERPRIHVGEVNPRYRRFENGESQENILVFLR